jgi:hypothetical protein
MDPSSFLGIPCININKILVEHFSHTYISLNKRSIFKFLLECQNLGYIYYFSRLFIANG